jgi:hypothetical protein
MSCPTLFDQDLEDRELIRHFGEKAADGGAFMVSRSSRAAAGGRDLLEQPPHDCVWVRIHKGLGVLLEFLHDIRRVGVRHRCSQSSSCNYYICANRASGS